jgi:iron complex outermembrane receptor protein
MKTLLKKSRIERISRGGLCALLCFVSATVLSAAEVDFLDFSLEELSQVPVSSLGRKNQSLMDSPAAAAIITNSEITRMGATTFADALRYVPGVQVADINSLETAVSVRGFNDALSSKLLVLMDGRSIYRPAHQWSKLELSKYFSA